jgi:hypothetical protein
MSNIFRRAILITVAGAGFALLQTPAKAWDGHPPAVSPAIAPGFPGAPGQEGRSSFEREDSFPCLYKGQIVVLKYRLLVSEAATIDSTGGSLALSFLGFGGGGGLNRTTVRPNLPEDQFNRQLDLARADTIISCAALGSNPLHKQELDWALRTQRALGRGNVDGMRATHALKQAYDALERVNPLHPKLSAAREAAEAGNYEAAIGLLSSH